VFIMRTVLVLACLLSFGLLQSLHAQGVPPSTNAGQVPQRFEAPPEPLSQPRGGTVQLPSTIAPDDAASIWLRVAKVSVRGSTVYGAEGLADLTRALTGRRVKLSDVYALAARITARYGSDGYILSRAIVPPQSLSPNAAVVRIEIIEGYVDQVAWPADIRQRYRDFFGAYEARIVEARPANINVIERYLLLAGDLPGLDFTSTFTPSTNNPKASTLVVSAKVKRLEFVATINNRGSEGRGPWQAQVTGTANNGLGLHEQASISYAAAVPSTEQLQFIEGTWRQVLTSEGLTLTLDASYNTGIPGLGVLQSIDYDSAGTLVTASLAYPVIRSRDENLIVTGIAFTEDVESNVFGALFTDDRVRGLRGRIEYDRADELGGISLIQTTLSQGIEGLGSTSNGNPLASRTGGKVDFTKLETYASRVQPLPLFVPGLSVFTAVYGQYAWDPLLLVEQCSYGGSTFGRAFDPSSITGDNCVMSSAEMRYDLDLASSIVSQTQLYVFVDQGWVEHSLASAGVPATEWGSSAGAGVRLGWDSHAFAYVEVAKGIGGDIDDGWHVHTDLTVRY
jgi:hemolysin activation/secretion protein